MKMRRNLTVVSAISARDRGRAAASKCVARERKTTGQIGQYRSSTAEKEGQIKKEKEISVNSPEVDRSDRLQQSRISTTHHPCMCAGEGAPNRD